MQRENTQKHSIFTLYTSVLNLFSQDIDSCIKIILEDENEINILVNIFIATDNYKARIKIR